MLVRTVRSVLRWTAALLLVALVVVAVMRGPAAAVSGIVGAVLSPMGIGLVMGVVVVAVWAIRTSSK